jgi:transcriptional regulator with XRE-family HTH domain
MSISHLLPAGKTHKELADAVGVTKAYIHYISTRRRVPSPEVFVKIALYLGLTVDELLPYIQIHIDFSSHRDAAPDLSVRTH